MSILSVLNSPKATIHDQEQSPFLLLPSEKVLEIFSKCSFADLLSCRLLCKKATQLLGLYPLCHRLKELKSSELKDMLKHDTEVVMEALNLELSLYSLERIRQEKQEDLASFDLSIYFIILLNLAETAENIEDKATFLYEAKEIFSYQTAKSDSENEGTKQTEKSDSENKSADVQTEDHTSEINTLEYQISLSEFLLKKNAELNTKKAELETSLAQSSYVFAHTLIRFAKILASFDKSNAKYTLDIARMIVEMRRVEDNDFFKDFELSFASVEFLIDPEKTKNALQTENENRNAIGDFQFKLKQAGLLFEVGLKEKAMVILNEVKAYSIKESDVFYLSKIAEFEAKQSEDPEVAVQTLSEAKKILAKEIFETKKLGPGPDQDDKVFEIAKVEATLDFTNVKKAKAVAKIIKNKQKQLIVILRVLNTTAKTWTAA